MDKWTTQNSRIVLDASPWLTVKQERCLLPDGTVIPDYNIVETAHVAIIFALTADQQVVMVRQYKHGARDLLLELPGGLIESESPLADARRELREETGYDSDQWQAGMTMLHNPTRENTRIYHFIVTDAKQVTTQHLDPTEDIQVSLMSVDAVLAAIQDNQIITAHSVGAIYHSLAHLGLIGRCG